MKKRYVGGFAAVVFALGFLLSQLLQFGEFGVPSEEGTAESATEEQHDDTSDVSLDNVSAGGSLPTTVSNSKSTPTPQFVTIAIHEDRYRLTSEDDPQSGVDVPLSEVVKQVKDATGGEQGVKLRIVFHKNAQEGALADLHSSLEKSGVKREEIQEISGYID